MQKPMFSYALIIKFLAPNSFIITMLTDPLFNFINYYLYLYNINFLKKESNNFVTIINFLIIKIKLGFIIVSSIIIIIIIIIIKIRGGFTSASFIIIPIIIPIIIKVTTRIVLIVINAAIIIMMIAIKFIIFRAF